jgi:agmatine deiminase
MGENLKILEKATDQDGKPFRIIKVPLPSIIEINEAESNGGTISDSELSIFLPKKEYSINKRLIKVATVSYLNFLLTNGMVINASYVNHGTSIQHEERVKAIFKEVFPDREQVWIDVLPINRNGGGIHCITQPEPLNRQLKVD